MRQVAFLLRFRDGLRLERGLPSKKFVLDKNN